MFSGDMKKPENLDAWLKLFEAINPIVHAVNCVTECLDFNTMARYQWTNLVHFPNNFWPPPLDRYRELKTSIIDKLKTLPGGIMGIHPSHFTNIAVHANQLPSKPHKDGLSNHNGLDSISSLGIFKAVQQVTRTDQ